MRLLIALILTVTVAVTPAYAEPGAQICSGPPAISATGQVAMDGTGTLNTRPFDLAGGAYTVQWSAATHDQGMLNLIVHIRRTDGAILGSTLLVNTTTPTPGGETHLYSVKPGAYYLDVMAPAAWAVTLTPL